MRAARHRKIISNEEPAAGEEAEVGGEGAKRKYKSRIVNGMEVLSTTQPRSYPSPRRTVLALPEKQQVEGLIKLGFL
ncbi:hypothetical protein TrCOL_g4244 [Triparma columacea]|uniref:Uncharacterized protein n=1 Tax=Triparma columacea TaxID=722753 RepID=A0A9W7LDQ2_9STRA|nr:hypothetical protein TrCOL_g4244 [Triparma columacea]